MYLIYGQLSARLVRQLLIYQTEVELEVRGEKSEGFQYKVTINRCFIMPASTNLYRGEFNKRGWERERGLKGLRRKKAGINLIPLDNIAKNRERERER